VSLKRNVVANYLGQGWATLMGIAFVPVYIRYLGMEAYGLIGLFAVLQTWLTLLDMGMTPALNREVARYSAGAYSVESIKDLVRTLEIVCVVIAVFLATAILLSSEWLATDWLNAQKLPVSEVAQGLGVMGFVAALRFVEGLYRGAVLGLQRQVWLNVVSSILATVRSVGAIGVLAWVSPTIQAFFVWQLVISAVSLACFALAVRRAFPAGDRPACFSGRAIANVWKFAGGMFLTTLLALLLTQVDKVLLSRLLSLESFGVYTFAAMTAGILFQLIGPIAQAYFPRLTQLTEEGDERAVAVAYHQGAQLMSIMLVPVGLVLIVFAEPLLVVWTGNEALAHDAAPIAAILAVGTVLNGWMHIPYMLQLASGWPSFAVRMNFAAVIVLVPAIVWVTPRYGPIGAAWIWVVVNAGYVLVAMHFMHVRLLPREKWSWYAKDIFGPTLLSGCAVLTSALAHPVGLRGWVEFVWASVTVMLALMAATLGASEYRSRVLHLLR
jgi:O-antigen/teichoic acid export membrane protein